MHTIKKNTFIKQRSLPNYFHVIRLTIPVLYNIKTPRISSSLTVEGRGVPHFHVITVLLASVFQIIQNYSLLEFGGKFMFKCDELFLFSYTEKIFQMFNV
jgi:hypothetical protein